MKTVHLTLALFAVCLLSTCIFSACKSEEHKLFDKKDLIEYRESQYNNIYVYKRGNYVSMMFGVNRDIYTESSFNPKDEYELPLPYAKFMTASLLYPEKINSILEIGSGGGRNAWYLHKSLPNAQITSVELDPVVCEIAVKHFGVHEEPNFHLVASDGRLFLSQSKDKYDVILIDAYRGPFVPFHLLTEEFYKAVGDHLAPNGVVAQNVAPSSMLFDSAVKTINRAFAQTEFYEASGTGHSPLTGEDVGGNVVIVAYNGAERTAAQLSKAAIQKQSEFKLRYDLNDMLKYRFQLRTIFAGGTAHLDIYNPSGVATGGIMDDAKVLTDDFAPVESLKAIARHNERNGGAK